MGASILNVLRACLFIAATTEAARPRTTRTSTVRTTAKPSQASSSSVAVPSSSTQASSSASAPAAVATKYLISFGDSYSQTGFDVNGTKPSEANPLGNPAYPGYTASGGPNWVGYSVATTNKTLLLSYNFAYGGATTDAALITPYTPTVKSFVDQVGQFSASIASKPSYAPWTSTNALFAVWIGVNDVGNGWYQSNWSTLVQTILDRYFSQVQILYNAGGRKFLFLTVPPIYKTPNMLAQPADSQTQIHAAVDLYNQLLSSHLDAFKKNNTGVTAYLYDTTVPFNQAIANPTAYGSPDATCYNGDGKSCLWFNDYHPGLAINLLIAQGIATQLGNW